jgi:hypothetical protein
VDKKYTLAGPNKLMLDLQEMFGDKPDYNKLIVVKCKGDYIGSVDVVDASVKSITKFRATGSYIFVIHTNDVEAHKELSDALMKRFNTDKCHTRDVIYVTDTSWGSYLCEDKECCPTNTAVWATPGKKEEVDLIIDEDKVKTDLGVSMARWLLTEQKKNARDVYLCYLVETYKGKQYGRLVNIIGQEYLNYNDDMQQETAELIMDVLSTLLFFAGEFDEFRKLQTKKENTSLGLLLMNSIEAVESGMATVEDFKEAFYVPDRFIEEEGYINA